MLLECYCNIMLFSPSHRSAPSAVNRCCSIASSRAPRPLAPPKSTVRSRTAPRLRPSQTKPALTALSRPEVVRSLSQTENIPCKKKQNFKNFGEWCPCTISCFFNVQQQQQHIAQSRVSRCPSGTGSVFSLLNLMLFPRNCDQMDIVVSILFFKHVCWSLLLCCFSFFK